MPKVGLRTGNMIQSTARAGYTLFVHLSWTGKVLIGEPGVAADRSLLELAPSLSLGSIWLLVSAKDSEMISMSTDHGDMAFPRPTETECLVLITADPMQLPPRALEASCAWIAGKDLTQKLPEAQSANAVDFAERAILALGPDWLAPRKGDGDKRLGIEADNAASS